MNLDEKIQNNTINLMDDIASECSVNNYNIKTKYQNPEIEFNNIENSIIRYNDMEELFPFITKYMENLDVNKYKMIIYDTDYVALSGFNGFPHLLCPVINKSETVTEILKYLEKTTTSRIEQLLSKRVKKIGDYIGNNSITDMPYILVIINDIGELNIDTKLTNLLKKICLRSNIVGIKFIFFTKEKQNKNTLNLTDGVFTYYNTCNFDHVYLKGVTTDDIKDLVEDMDGYEFETFTKKLLESNGFNDVEVTTSSHDFGVDVIAYKNDVKYAIQCKKYSSPVGIKAVQEVIGSRSIHDCDVAVVITNNTFTASAIKLAKNNRVKLWDKHKLDQLISNMD